MGSARPAMVADRSFEARRGEGMRRIVLHRKSDAQPVYVNVENIGTWQSITESNSKVGSIVHWITCHETDHYGQFRESPEEIDQLISQVSGSHPAVVISPKGGRAEDN